MEASTREASQTPKLYDHPGAKKALCGNILDSLKQKIDLQLKPTLKLYMNYVGNHTLTKESTPSIINMFLCLNNHYLW